MSDRTQGSKGRGVKVSPNRQAPMAFTRRNAATVASLHTLTMASTNLVAHFFITSILRRGVELDKLSNNFEHAPTGNPSSLAIPRPESPCALNRATSSRYASNVLGRPSLIPRAFAGEALWIASTAAECLNSLTSIERLEKHLRRLWKY